MSEGFIDASSQEGTGEVWPFKFHVPLQDITEWEVAAQVWGVVFHVRMMRGPT